VKKPVKLALAALAGAYAAAQLVWIAIRAVEPAAPPRNPDAQAWAAGGLAGSVIGLALGAVACVALLVSAFRRPPRAGWDEPDSETGRPAEPTPREARATAVPVSPPPSAARTAGVIWMVVGSLLVVTTCGGAIASILIEARRPGPATPNPAEACSTVLGLLIAVGFFVAGLRVVVGSARDTLVPGILSLLIGLFYLGLGLVALGVSRQPPPNMPPDVAAGAARLIRVIAVACIVTGYGLLLPGGLALFGRGTYLRWRAAAHPPRPRERRRPSAARDEFPWGDDQG